jgi:hypothetical protein
MAVTVARQRAIIDTERFISRMCKKQGVKGSV